MTMSADVPHSIEDSYDLIVVGSGGAGLTAAVTAATLGLKVVVLEKATTFGGTTAISGGGLWIPCNMLANKVGRPDSNEQAVNYFKSCTGNRFDARKVKAFLSNAPEMVEFLQAHTEVNFTVAADRPDYYPGTIGASEGGRTIFPLPYDGRKLGKEVTRLRPPASQLTFLGIMIRPGPELRHFMNVFRSLESTAIVATRLVRHLFDVVRHGRSMDLSNGNALIARLMKSALDRNVEMRTRSSVVELVMADGRVAGVTIEGTTDGSKQLLAKYGVILACGGFPHDAARQRELYPHAAAGQKHASPAPETNTGDGLRIAERVGAQVDANLSDAAAWAPVSLVPSRSGKPIIFPHLIDRQKPGFIAVTKSGKRFVNESGSYHQFVRGLLSACVGEREAIAYLIADHRTVRRYGMGFAKPAPVPLFSYLRSGYLIRANTIEALAASAGIDPKALKKTVEDFNIHARDGEDPEFGRGSTSYNRYNGDADHKPNPCVAPIEVGPFYATRIIPGDLGTFAGLKTDDKARVLHTNGHVIEGLYAVGNDMSHIMGGEYMGGGSTLGPACTFGYIAGRNIASSASSKR